MNKRVCEKRIKEKAADWWGSFCDAKKTAKLRGTLFVVLKGEVKNGLFNTEIRLEHRNHINQYLTQDGLNYHIGWC